MESVTPQALRDSYSLLPNDQQLTFLKLLGRISTAEVPFLISNELTIGEQHRFAAMLDDAAISHLMPIIAAEALRLVRESSNATDEELIKEITDGAYRSFKMYDDHVAEVERAKLKDKRDRKPDPETIQRNVEICNLRKQDKKTWTLGRLAKKYGVTRQSIEEILKGEEKWRRLYAQRPSK